MPAGCREEVFSLQSDMCVWDTQVLAKKIHFGTIHKWVIVKAMGQNKIAVQTQKEEEENIAGEQLYLQGKSREGIM